MKLSDLIDLSLLSLSKPADLPPELDILWDEACELERASLAPSSIRTYRSATEDVQRFCDRYGFCSFPTPPWVIALYLAHAAKSKKFATLQNRLIAIGCAHNNVGIENPTFHFVIRKMMRGISKRIGTAQKHAEPLVIDVLRPVVAAARMQPLEAFCKRDPAVLLWGYAAETRGSDLTQIEFEHLTPIAGIGYDLYVPRSKNDPKQKGAHVTVPYGLNPETCPVRTMQAWLDYAHITSGHVFREIHKSGSIQSNRLGTRGLRKIMKRLLLRAGLDPKTYSPHSLRAGGATTQHENGASDIAIMRRMRISTHEILTRYARRSLLRKPYDRYAAALML